MCPGGPLALRVDADGNAIVAGLTVHKVPTAVFISLTLVFAFVGST